DGNGKIEFFLGGSSFYNGVPATRIYWFEADGDNNYVKRRSFFLLGTDVLGFDLLSVYDINNDGIDDLVFSFSFSVVMLIWNEANQEFDLYYFDQWENINQEIHSVSMYDIFNQGYPELFISVKDIANPPRVKSFFYIRNPITGIKIPINLPNKFHLAQNYPNPFNISTRIRFNLPKRERISLTIYDVTGKEVISLINKQMYAPGEHTIKWNGLTNNGKEVSSGIYLYLLQSGASREVCKMLLIK
ncbi:MAG: T9SS type A sorting domain-containing protein, partial [Aliifodinibius sp.]|nr:T9SS type A sorting domain-containing protein [Fodinibius sp.]